MSDVEVYFTALGTWCSFSHLITNSVISYMKEKILQLKAQGKSYRDIAKILGIKFSTVSYYACPTYQLKSRVRTKNFFQKIYAEIREIKKSKGGQCETCHYNRFIDVLEFHHKDPNKKEFQFSKFKKLNPTLLRLEAEKCQLLCPTCHREIHYLWQHPINE